VIAQEAARKAPGGFSISELSQSFDAQHLGFERKEPARVPSLVASDAVQCSSRVASRERCARCIDYGQLFSKIGCSAFRGLLLGRERRGHRFALCKRSARSTHRARNWHGSRAPRS
jgi:hypothetical protein